MRSFLPILILALIFSATINAQQVFYSTPEKNPSDITDNYIIGKVKNNIVVWKHLATSGKSELLIYNYDMKLQNRVPLKFFKKGELYNIDFINRQSVFDIIVQYYIGETFYCKIVRFNEKGETMGTPKIIDEVKIKNNARNEVYGVIYSEDKQYIGLMRALVGVKKGCLQLNYLLVDKNLNIIKQKESLINFDAVNNEFSSLYLDNTGSVVFAKSVLNKPSDKDNYVVIYKIEKDNDTVLNIMHPTGNNFVEDLHLLLNNNSYIVGGIYEANKTRISKPGTAAEEGVFTGVVNVDLSEKSEDNYYPFKNIKGIDLSDINNATINIKSIINKKDSGFIITCRANNQYNAGNFFSVTNNDNDHRFNFSDQSFYRKPDLSNAHPIYSSTLVPTLPVYQSPTTGSGPYYNFNPVAELKGNFNNSSESSNLFILSFTKENQPQWSSALSTPSAGNETFYSAGFDITANSKNALHFIYPEEISDSKSLLKQMIITSSGDAVLKPIISNNFHYLFKIHQGVQIDEHSIVFPCETKGWLSFARVEFD